MHNQYESAWWRARIPEDWDASGDNVCMTFTSERWPGVIQVSAAAKEAAMVTEADLKEFAEERIAKKRVKTLKTRHFEGIHVEYYQDDNFWREWWLRSGNLMLYITYNVERKETDVERATVDEFVSGLEPLK